MPDLPRRDESASLEAPVVAADAGATASPSTGNPDRAAGATRYGPSRKTDWFRRVLHSQSSGASTGHNTTRTISVRTSPTQDVACEVIYVTEAGESTPWKGRADRQYCYEPALKLALKLDSLGWACAGR